jgi:DNA invertase Pin-like site-specific DNA recombinase
MTAKTVEEQASARLRLYVVEMLQRAEAMIPDLAPLESTDAAYTRISDDLEGQGLGVERQTEDSLRLAAQDGATIPEDNIFEDNDISASTLSKKPRPSFERLIAYVLTRQIKRVYAYSNSRLTRRPMELEVLIQLAEQYGLKIRTAVSGDDNLNTADGRMTARIKAAVDAAEAEKTSERVKRQKQQRLASGLPLGSRYRTFGYTAPSGGKQNPDGDAWEVIPEEADIVREVFERCAKGESVNSISRDLRARGVLTVSGKPFSFAATARILDSPIYAGLLAYKGEVIGKATVKALVTEAQFAAASQRATRPAWNTRKALLSGIALCDACKTPMNHTGGAYVCARIVGGCGKVRIKSEWLDRSVGHAVRFLIMWQRAQKSTKVEVAPVVESDPVEAIDRKIEKAQQAHTAGELDLADLLPILKALRAQRAKLVEEKTAAVEEDSTWAAMDDYDSADLSLKRSIIKRHIVAVPVVPSSKPGNNKFDPSRFKVVTTYKDEHGKDRILTGEACDVLASMASAREFDLSQSEIPVDADELIRAIWRIVDRSEA